MAGYSPSPPPYNMADFIHQTNERLAILRQHLATPHGYSSAVKALLEWCSNPRWDPTHCHTIDDTLCIRVVLAQDMPSPTLTHPLPSPPLPRSFSPAYEQGLMSCLQSMARVAASPGFDLELGGAD